MTDEEKLEEIKRTRKQIENFCNYKCAVSKGDVVCINCVRIYDFETGLTEGRKEKCLEQNNDGTIRPCEVMKENEELKAQIEQLSNDNHVLKTSFITQQEQIEKMKCCENCKHCVINNEWHLFCNMDNVSGFNSKFCDKWELVE